jgi:hypothetical protein
MMYGNNMSAGDWAFSIVATVIILALIVATIIWFASKRRDGQGPAVASAREILDRPSASDEIPSIKPIQPPTTATDCRPD